MIRTRDKPTTDSQLIRATIHDLRFLFELRNDPAVRKAFFNSKKIGKRAHEAWLRSTLTKPYVYLYIIQAKVTSQAPGWPMLAVGYCRLVCNANTGEISIAIHPRFRGWGLATSAIRSLIRKAKKLGIQPFAKVKAGNVASLKAFLKAGMRPTETIHFT